MSPDANEQAVDFFIKRANIASETAARHCKDLDYEKGLNLYKQAYAFYLKAQKNRPDDQELLTRINDVKSNYQDAKQKLAEKS